MKTQNLRLLLAAVMMAVCAPCLRSQTIIEIRNDKDSESPLSLAAQAYEKIELPALFTPSVSEMKAVDDYVRDFGTDDFVRPVSKNVKIWFSTEEYQVTDTQKIMLHIYVARQTNAVVIFETADAGSASAERLQFMNNGIFIMKEIRF